MTMASAFQLGRDAESGACAGVATVANGARSPARISTSDKADIRIEAMHLPVTANGGDRITSVNHNHNYDEGRPIKEAGSGDDSSIISVGVLNTVVGGVQSCGDGDASPLGSTFGRGRDNNADARAAATGDVDDGVDYVRRGQWLRAAVLGANDGLVSTASLMMGVGANYDKAGAMIVAGLAGLVGGACSMAIGEFVSVYTQRDAEQRHHANKRKKKRRRRKKEEEDGAELAPEEEVAKGSVGPSPWEAAAASAGFFAVGSAVPLLAAGFVVGHLARLLIMLAVCSVALAGMGAVAARLSAARPLPGAARVLVGGWLAMLLTFSLLRLFSVAV